MAAKKSTRATRSKKDTEQAFEQIEQEVAATPSIPDNEYELRQVQETKIRNFADGVSVEKAVQGITTAGLNIGKTLSSIATQVQLAADELEEIKKAKALYEKDIEDLHNQEIAASALEDLVAEYTAKKTALVEDHANELKALLQEKEDLREEWERQQAEHNRQDLENKASIQRNRQQEQEAYNYQTKVTRERADLEFKNKMSDQERANLLKEADLNRGWLTRETELKAKETEFVALKAKVETIPAEIDAAVKRAEGIAYNNSKRDYTHQIEMLQKTHESQQMVANNTIASLQAQVKQLAEANLSLQSKVTLSEEKVASIANNALNAASGRQALAELQGVVQTQGNNSNNKRT